MTTVGEYFARSVDRAGNYSLPSSIHLYQMHFWIGDAMVKTINRLSTDDPYMITEQFEEENYLYQQWFDNSSLAGEPIVSVGSRTTSINLYGFPTPKTYAITYSLAGGQLSNQAPTTFRVGQELSLITPTKVGYEFSGWYLDGNLSTAFNPNNLPLQNITLHAKWVGITTMIYFVTQQTINPITIQSGEAIGVLPTLTMAEGFVFHGWSLTLNDANNIITSDYVVGNSLTLQLFPIWSTTSPTSPINLLTRHSVTSTYPIFEIIVFISTLLISAIFTTLAIIKRNHHGSL
jgi:uncharacterized repeat protein (TIGR02543 family)